MRDLRQGLKSEAARHAPVSAPDLDSLISTARRRQIRRRIIGATATAALAVLVVAVGFTALVPDRPTGGDVADSDLDYFSIPTSDWQVGQLSLLALASGRLGFTDDGCPYIANEGARPLGLIFPRGARGVLDADGRRAIVDADGFLFGTAGDQVEYGGGAPGVGDPVHDPCESIAGDFVVQQVAIDESGEPCQEPAVRDDDRWEHVDFNLVADVGEAVDLGLKDFDSYGGTYWHRDGGVRVRVASERADTEEAVRAAEAIIAEVPDIVGGTRVETTSISLSDLSRWAADADDGLANIPPEDIVAVDVDELCQRVDIAVVDKSRAYLRPQSARGTASAARQFKSRDPLSSGMAPLPRRRRHCFSGNGESGWTRRPVT